MTVSKELTKVAEKKLAKRKKIYEAAYELFTNKGVNQTSIDDIAKKAGVGKGTFYLYFEDKYDIMDRIVLRKSSILLKEAIDRIEADLNGKTITFEDKIILFTDYVIEYLKENKKLLKLINKNLSWGIFRKALRDPKNHGEVERIKKFFSDNDRILRIDIDLDMEEKVIFMLIELISSVCYSSIILEEPDNIDNMKPILFIMIKKMLT